MVGMQKIHYEMFSGTAKGGEKGIKCVVQKKGMWATRKEGGQKGSVEWEKAAGQEAVKIILHF